MTPVLTSRAIDITGAVFGRLTVIGRAGTAGKTSTWSCRCSCGTEIVVRRNNLVSGSSTSCGCLARELSAARRRAAKRAAKACSVEGCNRLERKGDGGMCARHAQRVRRYDDPNFVTPEETRRTNNRAAQPRLGQLKQTTYKRLLGRHEHRVVVEAHIGRPLRTDEIVHHVDGNQHNNAIENLQIVTAEEHARIHREQGDLRRKA